ncbi:TetR/AcrR family transcriptional regulator [Tissierella praeacuta]|uniref:TetR/AcrR family transcriptional regulator n=1 Tax=Tissierella praeacuta TaxID=43131 RepID=UPI003519D161
MDNYNKNYKDIILSEAKDIAMKQGISNINIRAVAKSSGIAVGTVYNYFPSKADLLVAVIEEFWEGAFANVDWKSFSYRSFYDNLKEIYSILYHYLHKFKENWLEQLSLLKTQEKILGKQRQNQYFEKISFRIKILIDMDNDLKGYPWSEEFSKEKMARFIFENMLIMLRKEEEDISFFITILKKIMSN